MPTLKHVGLLLVVFSGVLVVVIRSGAYTQDDGRDANLPLLGAAAGAKQMPRLGFGTCCRKSARGQPLITSTLAYLSHGGRLIDTAQMYRNQKDLRVAIQQSGVPRAELWVTSKVNTNSAKSGAQVAAAVDSILAELGLAFADLILLHHAVGSTGAQRVEQWRALLDARRDGKVRNVGVSNYDRAQLEALEAATGVLPAVNQLEYHPWVPEEMHTLVRWCRGRGMAVTAYGSLGSSSTGARVGEAVAAVARRHNVSSAALLLRWSLNRGCAVIPGATSASHIAENLHVPMFTLSVAEETELLGAERPSSWRLWRNMGDAKPAGRSRKRHKS